ncbi:MAG: hypothetical protein QXM31_01795 [Candidatus Woesearchaeota archaeon]
MSNFRRLLEELKKLNLPSDKFAVFGSAPMAVRNIRDVDDLDVIVKQDLWDELCKKHKNDGNKVIHIGKIDIFRQWEPWFDDINPLIDTADIIDGIRYVSLDYLVKWKKMMNREKDRKDLLLVNDFLKKTT